MPPKNRQLPHDLEVGQKLSRWFAPTTYAPTTYAWYVGNIWEVNRRRTKSENVSVEFNDDTYGETRGMFVAAAETYGTDKLWVVLKPIPIELDSSPSSPS